MSKNTNKPARRSGEAVAAMSRNSAGPMRHRNQPRGGARNLQSEYIALADEAEDEYLDWEY